MQQTEQIHKIFEEREKQILEEASKLAVEMARKELALLEFEMFNEVMVSKASKEKAEKSLKKLRDAKWKKALEKANGNEEEATFIYGAS